MLEDFKMNIIIKENEAFGGFIGYLCDNNYCRIELPSPFNVSATSYTGKDKNVIINNCKKDAKIIFNIDNLNIIDWSV